MSAGLRVRVLGRFEIDGVADTALGSRKGRRLLKALALARGEPVGVDALADIVWGDDQPAKPSDQLSVLVSRARGTLGADRLPRTPAGYALVADWLDVDAMAELVGEADRRLAGGATTAARAAATAALTLARGPLLDDEPDAAFAEVDRAAAARLVARAHHTGARAALADGDGVTAAELAERALDHDPFDEEALRLVMTAHVRSGRSASALAVYAKVRLRLVEELGVDPSPETEALHTSILRGEVDRDAPPPDGALEPVTSLAGRYAELTALDAARAAGGFVVVEGEAGMGKTALLDSWTRSVRNATVLTGRCQELAQGLPLQAVLDALTAHVRALDPAATDELLAGDASLVRPFVAGSGTDVLPTGSFDQPTGMLLLFQAVTSVLQRLAPLVLVLDDIHLAGPLTFEWLQFAVPRLATPGSVLVVATRTEDAPVLPVGNRIAVGPLDLEAVTEVVGVDRAEDLLERSSGNPLFLVELAAADPEDELPASIRDAVTARVERAGDDVAATLRAAALLGEHVDLDVTATALGMSPITVLDHLEAGARRGLLREEGDGFSFPHALVRSALAAGASASRRALLHREAARALAARGNADPLVVANHARLGGDTELAAHHLVAAAEVASARFDQAEAERLVDESVALVETAEGWLAKGRIALLRRRYEEARRAADRAFELGAGAAAREVAAWAAHYQRQLRDAIALADDGAAVATDGDERAACLLIGAWARFADGDLDGCGVRLEAVRRRTTGAMRTQASMWLGALHVHQGRVDDGLALLEHEPGPTERIYGYPWLHGLFFRAMGLATAGRAEEALRTVDRLGAEIERVGAERWAGRPDNLRGWVLRNVGATTEADECNERALASTDQTGLLEPLAHAYLDLACGALLAGDPDRAAALVERARVGGAAAHALQWRHQLRARLLDGRVALLTGERDVVASATHDVVAEGDRLDLARYRVLGELLAVQAGHAVDPDRIGALLERLPGVAGLEAWWITADVARVTGNASFRALAERRVGELVARAGDRGDELARFAGRYLG